MSGPHLGGDLPDDDPDDDPDNSNMNLTSSLPGRQKTAATIFKQTKAKLLNDMKVATEKIWNLKKQANVDMAHEKFTEFLGLISNMETEENNGGLVLCGDDVGDTGSNTDVPLAQYPEEPPRRYDETHDINIYSRLPVSKVKKHPYSGRFGKVADANKVQYRAKLPISKQVEVEGNLIDDGIDGVNCMNFSAEEDEVEIEEVEEDNIDFVSEALAAVEGHDETDADVLNFSF